MTGDVGLLTMASFWRSQFTAEVGRVFVSRSCANTSPNSNPSDIRKLRS